MKPLKLFKIINAILVVSLFIIALTQPILYLTDEPEGRYGIDLMLMGVVELFLGIGWNLLLAIPYILSEGQDPNEYFVSVFALEKIISWATPVLLLAWIFSFANKKVALLYVVIVCFLTGYLYSAAGAEKLQTPTVEALGIGYWFWAATVALLTIGLIVGIATEHVED